MFLSRAHARSTTITATLALALSGLLAAPVEAADPPSALELAQAIARAPGQVTGASFVTKPPGASVAIGTASTDYRGTFPRHGSSFAIFRTGPGDLGGGSYRGPFNFDVTVLKIDVVAPASTVCLAGLDVRILSDTPYATDAAGADRFLVEIDKSTWKQNGSGYSSPFVAPDDLAIDAWGSPLDVSVRSGTARLSEHRANDTDFPLGSRTLTVRSPITPGKHSIYLSLVDRGSAALSDSVVLVDDLRFASAGPCPAGVVPAPGTVRSASAVTFDEAAESFTVPPATGVRYVPLSAPTLPSVLAPGVYLAPDVGYVTVLAQPTFDSVLQGASRWTKIYPSYAGGFPVKSSPPGPSFTKKSAGGVVTVPSVAGVSYRINGTDVAAGAHTVYGEVFVEAVSSTFALDGVTGWSFEFSGPAVVNPTPPILSVARPTISGTRKVGKTLKATSGVWNPPDVAVSYRWLRNGKSIGGATKSTYKLKAADAGQKISVRARATKAGFLAAESTSKAVGIARITPKLEARLVKSRIASGKRGKVRVELTVKGVGKPTGKLRVYVGGKKKTLSLKSKHRGRVTVSLPKLKVGKYPVRVKFLGTTKVKPSAKVKAGSLEVARR